MDLNVTDEEVEKAQKIMSIIIELDEEALDMDNLPNNSEKEINRLSNEAKDFYYQYKELSDQSYGQLKQEDVLFFISSYFNGHSVDTTFQISESEYTTMSSIRTKEWKVSNQRVKDILILVDAHGTGWAFAIA
ncbi:hypothetical protein SAMN05421736_11879 [Evansella caseinilytica]|uniref:Uncharacterized protein n=1 Tax=Evansella caseinilytica TaxID=1503961 RepID=A0A1H3U4X2_9BACI|nr:hypothetical protein [Evansella caseinilytica]SDZ57523.1 hypothetical protein SAMN05421736_11879 [Evansella caseinilytica]